MIFNFNNEERRVAWNLSDKKCSKCGLEVEWDDYHLDHKDSHNQGGKTLLENSQIMHSKCNESKSNS